MKTTETSPSESGFWETPHKKWGVLFAFFTLIGIINMGVAYTDELANSEKPQLIYPFVNEFSGVYLVLLLLPILIWFMVRYPLQRHNWWRRLPLHLLASVIFGFTHTTLMYLIRTIIYNWLDLGSYAEHYGVLKFRYLMEYQKQFASYWLIYGSVSVISIIIENQRQRVQTAKLEEQLTRTRLQALQMQLNPHFLFNTLNMISSTMYENVETADKMIANLSDLLRDTLRSVGKKMHPLRNELDLLGRYVDIMKARFESRLQVVFDIPGNCYSANVPRFFLQPLVENAIHHAMSDNKTAQITIAANISNHRLRLTVQDNGRGITAPLAILTQNGVGLRNTVERLETLFGEEQQFSIENLPEGGCTVTIEIPFQKNGISH
ncbi:MAG: histidine kinase [Calditrichaeota bacterium]|nr:histidine kinase [Calditrichota bacterium]